MVVLTTLPLFFWVPVASDFAVEAPVGTWYLGVLNPLEGFDPRLVGMALTRDGELLDTGAGAAALGDPVAVVAWLANVLGDDGVALEPGHIVMTGALHAAVPMNAGETFRAEFDRLGSVTVRVV